MNMNQYEIENAYETVDANATPNLAKAVGILYRLMRWTNSNSDGWPYWRLPSKASNKLQILVQGACPRFWDDPTGDITEADLKKALTPIKTFLTKREVEHSLILDDPPPPPCRHTLVEREGAVHRCHGCDQVVRPVAYELVS